MNIKGNWEGFYEYGHGYTLPQFGERVKTKFSLDGNEGQFNGTGSEEQSKFSVPSDSIINGFIENDMVFFKLTYPIIPALAEPEMTLEILPGQLEIEYSGYFDRKNQAMYGTWVIPNPDQEAMDQGYFSAGIWILRPVEN